MQPVSFQIDIGFLSYILSDIETKSADSTVDTALIRSYTIAGSITGTAKAPHCQLHLRLNIPVVL